MPGYNQIRTYLMSRCAQMLAHTRTACCSVWPYTGFPCCNLSVSKSNQEQIAVQGLLDTSDNAVSVSTAVVPAVVPDRECMPEGGQGPASSEVHSKPTIYVESIETAVRGAASLLQRALVDHGVLPTRGPAHVLACHISDISCKGGQHSTSASKWAHCVPLRAVGIVKPFGVRRPTARPQQLERASLAQQQHRAGFIALRSFEGAASKALKEAAALDELIDTLLAAKTQQELSRAVAENIFNFDAKFWMRIATRNDSLTEPNEKERLKAVADTVMLLVDAMVKQTEQKLNDSAAVLQEVLKAAADENGEWYLPLDASQVAAVRAALDKYADRLDEGLLSNCFAWMKKCQDDRMDTMVTLLQKVLQLYAAKALKGQETEGVDGILNDVVYAEEQDWEPIISKHAAKGEIAEAAFMEVLQKKMETTVLGMQSGSYAQRVQAEYLKEVEARAKTVFRRLAAAGC